MLSSFSCVSRFKALDIFLVFLVMMLSKSLYFESFFNNVILIPVFIFLFLLAIFGTRVNISLQILFFSLIFLFVVLLNSDVRALSYVTLMLRLFIAILLVSFLNFDKFSKIFTDIILVLGTISLLAFLVIFFGIESPFPDFVATDGRHLRNFIFFGVSENFIEYKIYRNSGLWWEPGAFQIFIMLGFFFSIINGEITKPKYFLFTAIILSTQSTAGIFLFFFLSLHLVFKKNSHIQTSLLLLLFLFSVIFILIPELDYKFNGNGMASANSRINDGLISFELFLDNILLGYGYGNQIEVAVPFGEKLLGYSNYHSFSKPTGSDGLTMFISQVGVFGILILLPFLYPSYLKSYGLLTKIYFSAFLFLLFNTQNFVFFIIFEILLIYGVKEFLTNYSVPYKPNRHG
ncbi:MULTISPECIES: hypothetical protein [unclassified Endozoicomonas]|uniref:hypothetical protein n=1 Tax=unclassified Endozoicomonas TaxID=2644528 RepID=UPI00214750EF|nr:MULTISPECIES: hypothetical protein [unclassified Endozoicomonas]